MYDGGYIYRQYKLLPCYENQLVKYESFAVHLYHRHPMRTPAPNMFLTG